MKIGFCIGTRDGLRNEKHWIDYFNTCKKHFDFEVLVHSKNKRKINYDEAIYIKNTKNTWEQNAGVFRNLIRNANLYECTHIVTLSESHFPISIKNLLDFCNRDVSIMDWKNAEWLYNGRTIGKRHVGNPKIAKHILFSETWFLLNKQGIDKVVEDEYYYPNFNKCFGDSESYFVTMLKMENIPFEKGKVTYLNWGNLPKSHPIEYNIIDEKLLTKCYENNSAFLRKVTEDVSINIKIDYEKDIVN